MPTPRFTTQMANTAGRSAPPGRADSNAWSSGVVAGVTGYINSTYQVYLDSGDYVDATSTLDSPIVVGDLVWVTRGGGQPLIVAIQ